MMKMTYKKLRAEDDKNPMEVKVTLITTLEKSIVVKVTDYEETYYGKDEDGNPIVDYDFSTCNLYEATHDVEWPQKEGWEEVDSTILIDGQ